MCSWASNIVGVALCAAAALVTGTAQAQSARADGAAAGPRFGFGRAAAPAEIAAWDIDVRPDGHGVPKGRGTVERGQEIYDAQCASCHGTFGESNSYLALAGGVEKDDIKTGRASRLTDPEVPRTLGTKLNAATTLFDYIRRAMPWPNPMSLSVDDTYAVSAYVLHLNEIVPADFELNDKNILTVPMPNRNGMTRQHGMGSVDGKPDVQGNLCMTNCAAQTRIVSELPEHARDAHGKLAQQFRSLGPLAAVDTPRVAQARGQPVATAAAAAPVSVAAGSPRELANRNACMACHGVDQKLVGPAFRDVSSKYASRSDAEAYVAGKIKSGGVGVWGQVPMPAQSVKDDEARVLARWILAGAK